MKKVMKKLLTTFVVFSMILSITDINTLVDCYAASTQIKKVTLIDVEKVSDTKAKLKWKKQKNVKGFEVYRSKKKKGKFKKISTVSKKKTTYTDTKAKKGNYYYKVRAIGKGKKKGKYSNTRGIDTRAAKKITNVVIKRAKDKKALQLNWSKKDAKGYVIYRRESEKGKFKKVKTTSKTKWEDTKVFFGKKYEYKIKGYKLYKKKKYYGQTSQVKKYNFVEEKIQITINGIRNEEQVTTTSDKYNISGKISATGDISTITYEYSSVTTSKVSKSTKNERNFTVKDIPMEIGLNTVQINVKLKDTSSAKFIFYVNRKSTTVEANDNVVAIDTTTDKGLNEVKEIYDKLENFWTDDKGTEKKEDDDFNLVVKEDNPLLNEIKKGTYKRNSIIYIPSCEYFPGGLSLIYKSHDDNYPSDYQYDASEYEIIRTQKPGITDLIDDDINISTTKLDKENPISFITMPEGTQMNIGRARVKFSRSKAKNKPGFQMQNLLKGIVPKVNFDDIEKGNINLKFDDIVIYDRDGDEDTDKDNVVLNGELTWSDIKPEMGLEWHPKLSDPLPQQIKSVIDYTENRKMSVKYGRSLGKLSDMIADYKEEMKSFQNKRSFAGMDIEGVDMDGTIVLGAVGLNLSTGVKVANMKTIQNTSIAVPFEPNLVIVFCMDVNGKIEANGIITYEYDSYVKKGINIQKKDFQGAHGSSKDNQGKYNFDIGKRNINIYSTESRAKDKLTQKPMSKLSLEADGEAESSLKIGGAIQLMMAGIVPAQVKANVGPEVKLKANGKLTLSTTEPVKFEGEMSANIKLNVKALVDANLQAKTFAGTAGFEYHKDLAEFILLEQNMATSTQSGTVYVSADEDKKEDQKVLAGAKVELTKNDATESSGVKYREATTDGNGKFSLKNLSPGKYTMKVSKDGYSTYIDKELEISGYNDAISISLDSLSVKGELKGIVQKADYDMDKTNNEVLKGAEVTLKKENSDTFKTAKTTTDDSGQYIFKNLPIGTYTLTITKEDYQDIVAKIKITNQNTEVYNAVLEIISNEFTGTGVAKGRIIDALNGKSVGNGIKLKVIKGYNVTEGDIIKEVVTDGSGAYTFELPAGWYTVQLSDTKDKKEYRDSRFNMKILGNHTIENQNGEMTPILNDGEIRVVLTWGSRPSDLDSHMNAKLDDGTTAHVFYNNKNYYKDNTHMINLDLDDTSSYGPETTTIYQQEDGIYKFSVHNYSNLGSSSSTSLSESGAMVKVYSNQLSEPVIYYVPNMEGTAWDVFSYNSKTKEFQELNRMYYESSPSYVGKIE